MTKKIKPWGNRDLMVLAAFRYCLGRMTYMPSECVEWLIAYWNQFDKNIKELIKKETKEAIVNGNAGVSYDVKEWEKILELKDAA